MRIVGLTLLLVVAVGCTSTASPAPITTPESPRPAGTAPAVGASTLPSPAVTVISFKDGKHRVGADVPPGTYRSMRAAPVGGEDFCYWERVSGFGGSEAEQIANSAGTGSRVATISASDAGFISTGCGTWTSDLSSPNAPIGDGVWIVGVDLVPGRYRSDGGSTCLWQRLGGFGGTDNESLQVGEGGSVEIRSTDRGFLSLNCGTWVRA
jgi:hypothetical protein